MRCFPMSRFVAFSLALGVSVFADLGLAQDNPISGLSSNLTLNEREAAKDRLIEMGTGAIPLLIRGLKNSDKTIKIESTRLLGELKATEAVPDLLQQLRTTRNTELVLVTTYTLGQIQDYRVTPELLDMASPSTRDPLIRQAAVVGLGLSGDTTTIPFLEKLLDDGNELLRIFTAGSLGMLGNDKGLHVALGATRSLEFSTRVHAIQALGFIGNNDAIPHLNEMLKNKPKKVEKDAIELAIFQINLKDFTEMERVTSIKNQILTATNKTALTRWCLKELVRIGGLSARRALNEIIQSPIREDIRKEAIRKLNILKIKENMEGGTSNAR